MKSPGRPRTNLVPGRSLQKRMPKKETEIMRQMRAAYMAMGGSRSYKAVAEQFGYSPDWVAGCARAFNWIEDARKRDESINNTFVEEHQGEINEAQKLLFASMLHDIKVEALKRGIKLNDSGVIEKLNHDGMTEAMKELQNHVVGDIVVGHQRGYKDINELINAMRKVVHEWNQAASGNGSQRAVPSPLSGAKVDTMNVVLMIEK